MSKAFSAVAFTFAAVLAGFNPSRSSEPHASSTMAQPSAPSFPTAPPPESAPEPQAGAVPEISAPRVKETHDTTMMVKALRAEIVRKERLSDEYWAAANKINDLYHIGTMFNEVDIPQHKCFVLGRLLGHADAVKKLEVTYDPDFTTQTTENAQDLRVMAHSLHNFVFVANRLIELSYEEWVLEWNLDCAGQHGIPASFVSQDGIASFYLIKGEGKVLQVLGDIEADFSKKLIDALERNPKVEMVALGSGGGSVYEALRAGQYIRAKGLDTMLWNGCYSACPFVFMGGVNRTIWSPYPVLGFHQVSLHGDAASLDSQVYRDIYHYTAQMGMNSHYVLSNMWDAPPEAMKVIEGDDTILCDAKVTTWVQRGCSAEGY